MSNAQNLSLYTKRGAGGRMKDGVCVTGNIGSLPASQSQGSRGRGHVVSINISVAALLASFEDSQGLLQPSRPSCVLLNTRTTQSRRPGHSSLRNSHLNIRAATIIMTRDTFMRVI